MNCCRTRFCVGFSVILFQARAINTKWGKTNCSFTLMMPTTIVYLFLEDPAQFSYQTEAKWIIQPNSVPTKTCNSDLSSVHLLRNVYFVCNMHIQGWKSKTPRIHRQSPTASSLAQSPHQENTCGTTTTGSLAWRPGWRLWLGLSRMGTR